MPESPFALPPHGFIRLAHVLKLIPVGRTRWYQGVKSGEYPKPVCLGTRARAYRVEDIVALIERLSQKVQRGQS